MTVLEFLLAKVNFHLYFIKFIKIHHLLYILLFFPIYIIRQEGLTCLVLLKLLLLFHHCRGQINNNFNSFHISQEILQRLDFQGMSTFDFHSMLIILSILSFSMNSYLFPNIYAFHSKL